MAQLLRLINKIFEPYKSIFNNLYRPNSINQGGVKAHWRQLPLQLIPHKELSCAMNPAQLRWTQVGCDTCYAMAMLWFFLTSTKTSSMGSWLAKIRSISSSAQRQRSACNL